MFGNGIPDNKWQPMYLNVFISSKLSPMRFQKDLPWMVNKIIPPSKLKSY